MRPHSEVPGGLDTTHAPTPVFLFSVYLHVVTRKNRGFPLFITIFPAQRVPGAEQAQDKHLLLNEWGCEDKVDTAPPPSLQLGDEQSMMSTRLELDPACVFSIPIHDGGHI